MNRLPGRLFAALALALFVTGAALGQTGRVGWDGTWAGGWDKGEATATRIGNPATLAVREQGKSAVSVALKRE